MQHTQYSQKRCLYLLQEPLYDQSNCPSSVQTLRNSIPVPESISSYDHPGIEQSITIDDLTSGSEQSPKHRSPGTDCIPYKIPSVLLNHPRVAIRAVQVYNDALTSGIFPSSWLTTYMCLLPKKGDLTDQKNWTPISLINANAKIFTRLVNRSPMPHINQLITTNQLGFMPG